MKENSLLERYYGNRLRLRVCGICIEQDRILMVRHEGLGSAGELWIPPGGEVELGQTVPQSLEREFREETGLSIETGPLLFVHEHLQAPFHAVELFFKVSLKGGTLQTGFDPELPDGQQIIKEVRFFTYTQLKSLGNERLHAMVGQFNSLEELINASGYFKFGK
jgi:8-oxo-dGTP diphosphatase